jgi:hypothetical protein
MTPDLLTRLRGLDEQSVDSLLEEIGDRNHVRVVKVSAVRPDPNGRTIHRVTLDEEGTSKLFAPALIRLDELRLLAGLPARYVRAAFSAVGAELVDVAPNLRVNVGIDFVADSLSKTSGRPAAADFMALSENGTAIAAGDTTIASEISTNGLARAAATYAHTGSATSYTLQKQFTASGSFSTVQKDGILNAASSGTLFVASLFTAAALISGDQLTVTHTINI